MAGGAAASAGATQLSVLYNSQLNIGLSQLSASGMNIIPVNSFALLNELIANPSAYGFTNATAPACGASATSLVCGPVGSGLPYTYAAGTDQTYVFADGVHPTQGTDRVLAQAVLSEIAAPGQTSLLSQAPLTSITTQTRTVRQEMLNDGSGSGTRMFAHANYSQQSFDLSDTSPKVNSNNFDLTLGGDLRYNDNISMGAALGLGHTNAGVVGGAGGYVMQDISALAYVTYHSGGAYAGAYGEAGHSHFTDVDRIIQLGPMTRTESGNTGGSHGGVGLTGGWWFGQDKLQYGPFANVEWHTIGVSGFQEGGNDGTAMWFANQHRKALVSTLGVRMQGEFQISNAVLKPFVELSWNHDSKADPSAVTAGLTSMAGSFTLTGYVPDKTWGMANVGLTTQLTPSVSSWVGYTGRFSDSSQRYNNINMGFRILL
jgi:outer membrane lipase/esterase